MNSRTKIPRIYVCGNICPVSDNLCIFGVSCAFLNFWMLRALRAFCLLSRIIRIFHIVAYLRLLRTHETRGADFSSFFSRLVLRYFIVQVVSRSLPRSFRVNSTFQLNVTIAT